MTTAQTLIDDAFREARIITDAVSPTTSQRDMGLRFLNRIIGRLSAMRMTIPYSTSESFSIGTSSQSYTMGSGGTASSARAKKITNCYIRDAGGNDWPVEVVSETDWNDVFQKSDTGRPYMLFYDPVYDTGVIYFYFKPDQTYTAYIESQKDLHAELALGDTVALPREYEDMLVLMTAYKISRALGGANEQALRGDAELALSEIKGVNISQRVPCASLPFSAPTIRESDWLFSGWDS